MDAGEYMYELRRLPEDVVLVVQPTQLLSHILPVIKRTVISMTPLTPSRRVAICSLHATGCDLLCEFTSDVELLENVLDRVCDDGGRLGGSMDASMMFGSLFDTVTQVVGKDVWENGNAHEMVDKLCHVVVIHTSDVVLVGPVVGFRGQDVVNNPVCHVDCLFLHSDTQDDDTCQEVFDVLVEGLDSLDAYKQTLFVEAAVQSKVEVCRELTRVLSHPLLRNRSRSTAAQ